MATTAELEQRLAALNEAMASGTRSISVASANGTTRSVVYSSFAEMERARADLERQLGGGTTRLRAGRVVVGRGL